MKSIGNILQTAHEHSSLIRGVLENKAVEAANKFLLNEWGQKITNQAQAVYLKNKILIVFMTLRIECF